MTLIPVSSPIWQVTSRSASLPLEKAAAALFSASCDGAMLFVSTEVRLTTSRQQQRRRQQRGGSDGSSGGSGSSGSNQPQQQEEEQAGQGSGCGKVEVEGEGEGEGGGGRYRVELSMISDKLVERIRLSLLRNEPVDGGWGANDV